MKTTPFLLALFLPLFAVGQSTPVNSGYPIVLKGEYWIDQGHPDSALAFAETYLSRIKSNPFERRQALFVSGKAQFHLGEPDAAISPLKNCVLLSQKNKDKPLLLKSLIVLSAAHIGKNEPDLETALFYLEGAKTLAEETRDTFNLAKVYINLSAALFNLEEFEQAIQYNILCDSLLKSTQLEFQKAQNFQGYGNCLMEIYTIDENPSQLLTAQKLYQKALAIYRKLNDKKNEAHIRNAIGTTYLYTTELDKAASEIKASIEFGLGEGKEDPEILINGYYNLASVYQMNGDLPKAIEALRNLMPILKNYEKKNDVRFIVKELTKGETEISYVGVNILNSIFEKVEEKNRIAKESQYKTYSLIALLIVSLGLVVFFNQRIKIKSQQIKILTEEKEALLKEQEVKVIQARLDGEKKSRQVIVQQIHDGVGGLLICSRWNLQSLLGNLSNTEKGVADKLHENLRLQDNSYQELRRVMYQLERDDSNWWEDLQIMYENIETDTIGKVRFYTYNLGETVKGATGEEARVIVQELITNAIKHSNASEISVQINNIDDTLVMIIDDDGKGLQWEKIQKGMGIRNIEARVKNLGGSISFDPRNGTGTTVFIDIPLPPHRSKESPLLYAGNN